MPRWGLTTKQIAAEPWGIPKSWLAPSKTVTDPVHGDVYLNELERRFLDSKPMQRLRRVQQLGTTHLVYPGATQTRFSHGLGTLRAAQDLLDAVLATRQGPRPAPDLFAEWDNSPGNGGISEYDRKLAEVTVVARLGALLHDFCHVPFGHTIEDELVVLRPHDENWARFDTLWGQLPADVRAVMDAADLRLRTELEGLIVSKKTRQGAHRDIEDSLYPFVSDIVGNTICADLVDYLQRDHLYTGLPMALGERFTTDFYVNNSRAVRYAGRMVIRITRKGRERVDVVSELLKYLRYRYELSERVLTHHAKIAADAMIGKLLEMWSDWLWVEKARELDATLARRHGRNPRELKDQLRSRPTQDRHGPEEETLADRAESAVEADLEHHFTTRGDSGLLEFLCEWGEGERPSPGSPPTPEGAERFPARDDPDGNRARRSAVGELAEAVLNRRLYKLLGRANQPHARAIAKELHSQFGDPDARRELEMSAARRAGLVPRWGIVIWLPPAEMRLKVAGVLVDQNGNIAPLDNVGHRRAEEIYEAHENLWAISIYGLPFLATEHGQHQADVLLAHIAERLQVEITRVDGTVVPSLFDLVVQQVVGERDGSREDERRLQERLEAEIAGHRAGGAEVEHSYAELLDIAHALAVPLQNDSSRPH